MRLLSWAGAILALTVAAPASAAWNVAQSKHFIIYSDDNPKHLYEFASKLERFDQAVRVATHMIDPQIGDGNRLTVFVLPKVTDVRSMMGDKTGFFAGFYKGRVAGSVVYVPKKSNDPDEIIGDELFFHEYGHHLMGQDLDHPYPEWYIEGFAEFFSTPKFDKDGGVWLGRPAQGRAYGLFNGPQLPLASLFAGLQPNMTNEQREVFYGRGWLLSHYLLMEPGRRGQLAAYIAALSNGKSSTDAARQAFGDLQQLDKELDAYRHKSLLQFKIGGSQIHLDPITVAPLSPGGSQVILARAKLKNDPLTSGAEALAVEVRQIESRFPGDDLVERTLAEAELGAGHAAAAEAAAERALKSNPGSTEAMVLKGQALADRAEEAQDPVQHELFEQARKALIAANKLDTEDPEPLYEYYQTFAREGVRPTANALSALHYASDLAPQDLGVRMNSAIAYLNEKKPREARTTLIVVAYSPHAADVGDLAKRMIGDIDAGHPDAALEELRAAPSRRSTSN